MKTTMIACSLLASHAVAQKYTYATRTVTECFSTTPASFGPPKPTQGPDSTWTITIPECRNCGCKECTFTHQYTATFDVFSPNGTAKWEYPIKELYPGMSTLPAVFTPTSFPYGFTTALRTCRICGDEPVAATMTYPRGAPPYRQNIPLRDNAIETQPAKTFIIKKSMISPASTFAVARETGISEQAEAGDYATGASTSIVEKKVSAKSRSSSKRASRVTHSGYRISVGNPERGTNLDDDEAIEEVIEESTNTLANALSPTQRTTPIAARDYAPEEGVANRKINGPGVALILPLALII